MYLGIDIGGTKIAGATVGAEGEVVRRYALPTPAREGGAAILRTALAVAHDLAGPEVVGIGIGTGGQVDAAQGVVVSATEVLPGWAGTALSPVFTEEFGMPVAVDNDVNALAVGEARFGAARDRGSVVFLALGTGVGGAFLVNRSLLRGEHWAGAEFGHLLLTTDDNARRDGGGHIGTLEAYVSGGGLAQTWREVTGNNDQDVTARDIVALAGGEEAIRRTGEWLGYGLTSLANCLDPEVFVIGGGLAELGDALLEPARVILRRRALPHAAQCPVLPTALGPDAAVIGAAALVMPAL